MLVQNIKSKREVTPSSGQFRPVPANVSCVYRAQQGHFPLRLRSPRAAAPPDREQMKLREFTTIQEQRQHRVVAGAHRALLEQDARARGEIGRLRTSPSPPGQRGTSSTSAADAPRLGQPPGFIPEQPTTRLITQIYSTPSATLRKANGPPARTPRQKKASASAPPDREAPFRQRVGVAEAGGGSAERSAPDGATPEPIADAVVASGPSDLGATRPAPLA